MLTSEKKHPSWRCETVAIKHHDHKLNRPIIAAMNEWYLLNNEDLKCNICTNLYRILIWHQPTQCTTIDRYIYIHGNLFDKNTNHICCIVWSLPNLGPIQWLLSLPIPDFAARFLFRLLSLLGNTKAWCAGQAQSPENKPTLGLWI